MPTVTIGFVPRERFSRAPDALARILKSTTVPFNLLVVDCNTPRTYWQAMEELLSDRNNVKVIHKDHYLLPNASRNLVVSESKDEFVCLIENDVLVEHGWISPRT